MTTSPLQPAATVAPSLPLAPALPLPSGPLVPAQDMKNKAKAPDLRKPLVRTPFIYSKRSFNLDDTSHISIPGGFKAVTQRELDDLLYDIVYGHVRIRPDILATVQHPVSGFPTQEQYISLGMVQLVINWSRADIMGDKISACQQAEMAWIPIKAARHINQHKHPQGPYGKLTTELLMQYLSMKFHPTDEYDRRREEIIAYRQLGKR